MEMKKRFFIYTSLKISTDSVRILFTTKSQFNPTQYYELKIKEFFFTRSAVKVHWKKVSKFPVPSRDVTHRGRNNDIICKLFPARESVVSDIPAGDGNIANLFLQCCKGKKKCKHLTVFDSFILWNEKLHSVQQFYLSLTNYNLFIMWNTWEAMRFLALFSPCEFAKSIKESALPE